MVEKRQVTGQAQGELLSWLLNREVDKRDRRAWQLQQELRTLFTAVVVLNPNRLPAVKPGTDWPPEFRRVVLEINRFLKTCAEYPFVQIYPAPTVEPVRKSRAVLKQTAPVPPRLVQEFAPAKAVGDRRDAVISICALVRYGLLDRERQCQRCGKFFFAKKSDSSYCSRNCQMQPTEKHKQIKREYAKRRYWEEKQLNEQAESKVRGGRK